MARHPTWALLLITVLLTRQKPHYGTTGHHRIRSTVVDSSLSGPSKPPPATARPFSTLEPEWHFPIAKLTTSLCFKSLQWQWRIPAGVPPAKVISICNNLSRRMTLSSLKKWQVMKKRMDLGEMLYLRDNNEKRLIWLWQLGLFSNSEICM